MKKLEGSSSGRSFASPARILGSWVIDAWVKGKHTIEVLFDGEDDEETSHALREVHNSLEEEQPRSEGKEDESRREKPKKVVIATLSRVPKYYTFRIRGVVQGHRITALIDGGATHNFIDAALVDMKGIPTEEFERIQCGSSRRVQSGVYSQDQRVTRDNG
jgi:hypothetical protein